MCFYESETETETVRVHACEYNSGIIVSKTQKKRHTIITVIGVDYPYACVCVSCKD